MPAGLEPEKTAPVCGGKKITPASRWVRTQARWVRTQARRHRSTSSCWQSAGARRSGGQSGSASMTSRSVFVQQQVPYVCTAASTIQSTTVRTTYIISTFAGRHAAPIHAAPDLVLIFSNFVFEYYDLLVLHGASKMANYMRFCIFANLGRYSAVYFLPVQYTL